MNRLINTFKYGSWKTRLFFGAILLALLGGAATIAIAAFAGLGIIPIAVGGAAMVFGIGMSTMVKVVSDDDENEDADTQTGSNPGDGQNVSGEGQNVPGEGQNAPGEGQNTSSEGQNVPGEGQNASGEGQNTSGENKNAPDGGRNVPGEGQKIDNRGNSEEVPISSGKAVQNDGGTPDVKRASAAGRVSGNQGTPADDRETLEQAVQRIKDSVIRADDGGRYVPDEITEKAVPKASYVMKRVKTTTSLSPSDGPFIDGLPPEKPQFNEDNPAAASGENTGGKTSGNGKTAGPADQARKNVQVQTKKTDEPLDESTGEEKRDIAKKKTSHEYYAIERKKETKKDSAADTGNTDNEDTKGSGRSIFGRLLSLFGRNKGQKDESGDKLREKEHLDKEENRKAKKRHILQGRKSREERKQIRRSLKAKTDEYEDSLNEKFENELSYEEKEKLREEEYAREVGNRRDRMTEETSSTDEPEGSDGMFNKIGNFFVKLFGNVYDEPGEKDEDGSSGRDGKKSSNTEDDSQNRETKKKKERKKKDKDKDKNKDKNKENGSDDGDTRSSNIDDPSEAERRQDRLKDIATGRAEKDEEEDEPRRERLPGEEPDVSKYSVSNMKKIIKSRKLGKDFIPVFIESWESKKINQTPALCFVKDDHVHFLLLEGDMERDVSVPTDKFINVWYRKNVPVINLKLYKNIRENMGAFEMFEDVMPAFASSTDQMGQTSYTQNLYLLGNDIALAPASMRELRRRFRFNTNIFDSLNTRGDYSDYFKKAYENRILWTDNVIGLQEYQRRIRAILQEMVSDEDLLKFEFEEDVAKMVQYRLITDEYADFYLNLKKKK
ncbi:MAG: hypothetical protein K6E62_02670 [Lachnospiraceae bacterium]|nr:hypothetical protein [Lachnospiraceae bacterium]